MKPRQPAKRKVLIPEDEKKMISGVLGDFLMKGKNNEENVFYIRVGNRRTSR